MWRLTWRLTAFGSIVSSLMHNIYGAAPPLSATTTVATMEKVWFLFIDHEVKPTFGEPLFEWSELSDTIQDLKIKIKIKKGGLNIKSFYDENSNVQHLAPVRVVRDFGLANHVHPDDDDDDLDDDCSGSKPPTRTQTQPRFTCTR
ncbi:hypothetical protein EDB86DRAFT_2955186 [Lactarius hatsudake]|nr:hypothetical protein EDB86DRAFT_2955186 [Lactarius hatsudake]